MPKHANFVIMPNKKVSRYSFAEQKLAKATFLWKFAEARGGRRSIF
jgi:hypothetical protein